MMPDRVAMVHGAGGVESRELIRSVFLRAPSHGAGQVQEDAALFDDGRLAVTTDAFVVDPPRFPGGDIGKLAVCGTVNDLAVRGARARWLAAAWLIPVGTSTEALAGFADSMARTATEAGAELVTGDTKVLAAADLRGPVVTTTGVGVVSSRSSITEVRPGDRLIVTGGIGEHAAALLAVREGLIIDGLPPSDCRLLSGVTDVAFQAGCHFARDATRGGLAAVLHEIAEVGPYRVRVDLPAVPVSPGVAQLCDILGVSPLTLACEGCAVLASPPERADAAVSQVREHRFARRSAIVADVMPSDRAWVELHDRGRVTWLSDAGEPLPRLC